jgi:arabinoxylan arabinofuranohydrolase
VNIRTIAFFSLASITACSSDPADNGAPTGTTGGTSNVASGGAAAGAGGAIGAGGTPGTGGVDSAVGGMAAGGSDPGAGGASAEVGGSPAAGGADGVGVGGGAGAGAGGTGSGGAAPSDCVPVGQAHNPLITHMYTADPNAIVYGDRIYVYASHDADGQDDYLMVDYHVFSSDDMVNWRDHGVIIDKADVPWLTYFYAPGACERNGKYYIYMPDTGNAVGVAVSDDPGGPFVDPLSGPLVDSATPGADVQWRFDPACFIDDDGQAYLYFGGGANEGDNARVVRLNEDMVSLMDSSASSIRGTSNELVPDFFEALHMHKHDGVFYLQYSADSSVGTTIQYGTGTNPMGPFEFHGDLLGNAAINQNHNNHASLVDYKGKSYQFYHNRKLRQDSGVGTDITRSIAVQEITYTDQNTLNTIQMTSDDYTVPQLKCLDGFQEVEAETIAEQEGIEVLGKAGDRVRVADIQTGDWVRYSQVDFRMGATKLVATVSASPGDSIDVRIDGCNDGASIGTCDLGDTDGFSGVSCDITATSGGHDLCLVFTGSPEFDSWHLE